MAGSPGGHEVARLSVKVVPDTSNFAKDLKAYLQKQEKSNKLNISVELDTKAAETKLKELSKKLSVTLKVNIDAAGVKAKIDALSKNQAVNVKANVDDAKAKVALAELQKSVQKSILAKLDDTVVQREIDKLQRPVNKTINAILKVAKTNADVEIASITRDRTVKINTDLNDLAAKLELDLLARDRRVNIKADVDKSFLSRIGGVLSTMGGLVSSAASKIGSTLSSGFSQAGGAISSTTDKVSSMGNKMQGIGQVFTVAIYAVIIPAIIGLGIAIGAIAGALILAFAPAVFIAAGVAFLALTAKGKGTAAKLKKAFADVAKTAKNVISYAVKPMTDAIAAQIPKLDNWIKTLKGPLREAFTGASKYVSTFRLGLQEFVSNTLDGLAGALSNPKTKPAVDGLRSLLNQLGWALDGFFNTLANSGPDFGKTLVALGNQLPPIAVAFAKLLGAFAKVAPDLINRIGTGIVQILKAFSDPNVVDSLDFLANISFDTLIASLQLAAWTIAILANTWNALKLVSSNAAKFVEGVWNGLASFLSSLWNGIKTVASIVWNAIVSVVVSCALRLASGVQSTISGLGRFLSSAWSGIKSVASSVWNAIVAAVLSIASRMVSGVLSAINNIKRFFSGLGNYISGVADTISSTVGWIIGLASKAKNAISGIFGLSPTLSLETTTEGFGKLPSIPMGGLFDFQGDLNSMESSASKLNSTTLKSASSVGTSALGAGTAALAQKIYTFGDIIANNEPTEATIIKALSYADALYA